MDNSGPHNNSILVSDIHSRLIVSIGASNGKSHVDPLLVNESREAQVEKKRRREAQSTGTEDVMQLGYVSIVNNPLATDEEAWVTSGQFLCYVTWSGVIDRIFYFYLKRLFMVLGWRSCEFCWGLIVVFQLIDKDGEVV